MRNLLLIAMLCMSQLLSAQSILGLWKNIDDEDGKAKSHIKVYEENGKIYGMVEELLEGATITVCDKCKGEKKGKPLVGMQILWDLEMSKNEKKASGGTIMDPKNGKEYSCKIELDGDDVLNVRGYIGTPLLGRTQKWYRVK